MHRLAKLGVARWTIRSPGEEESTQDPMPSFEVLKRNAQSYFGEYAETGHFPPDRELFLLPRQMTLLTKFVYHAHLFVVAHEYAHIINGDFTNESVADKLLATRTFGTEELRVIATNHTRELGADALAIAIMFAHFFEKPTTPSAILEIESATTGILLFFRAAELLENLLQPPTHTHPRAANRYAAIKQVYLDAYFAQCM